MSCDQKVIPRPNMSGRLNRAIGKQLLTAIILGLSAGFSVWRFMIIPFKEKHIQFHKTYDIDKSFEQIRETGAFDSC